MIYLQGRLQNHFMRSIREVDLAKRVIVKQMLEEFIQKMDETNRPNQETNDRLFTLWSEGKIVILGKFDNQDQILGIVILSLPSNKLSLVHVSTTSTDLDKSQVSIIEKELFDAGFDRLKRYESWVTSGGSVWLTKNLIKHAMEVGFKRYDKIGMKADREAVEAVPVPEVPSGYTLDLYDNQWKDAISLLLYESFKDSDSAKAEPNELYTLERCLAFVNDTIHGRYGNFKNGSFSWVLKFGNEIVGVTLRTLQGETAARGAVMCLKQSYQGKGLGKLIFIHSLRYLLKQAPKVSEIRLSVIETNPAKHLYNSVGFKEISKHSIYTWVKDDKT